MRRVGLAVLCAMFLLVGASACGGGADESGFYAPEDTGTTAEDQAAMDYAQSNFATLRDIDHQLMDAEELLFFRETVSDNKKARRVLDDALARMADMQRDSDVVAYAGGEVSQLTAAWREAVDALGAYYTALSRHWEGQATACRDAGRAADAALQRLDDEMAAPAP